jgi:hypothetical protein
MHKKKETLPLKIFLYTAIITACAAVFGALWLSYQSYLRTAVPPDDFDAAMEEEMRQEREERRVREYKAAQKSLAIFFKRFIHSHNGRVPYVIAPAIPPSEVEPGKITLKFRKLILSALHSGVEKKLKEKLGIHSLSNVEVSYNGYLLYRQYGSQQEKIKTLFRGKLNTRNYANLSLLQQLSTVKREYEIKLVELPQGTNPQSISFHLHVSLTAEYRYPTPADINFKQLPFAVIPLLNVHGEHVGSIVEKSE